jgi:hypothetical protein
MHMLHVILLLTVYLEIWHRTFYRPDIINELVWKGGGWTNDDYDDNNGVEKKKKKKEEKCDRKSKDDDDDGAENWPIK